MPADATLTWLVTLAGWGQIALAAASLAIPSVLGWRAELQKLRPLLRQMFWVYAAYILGIHVGFGLVSALAPAWLLDRSPLAAVVTGFITVYWPARLLIPFFYFDRRDAPPAAYARWAEAGLVTLFVYLAAVYGTAFYVNLHAQ